MAIQLTFYLPKKDNGSQHKFLITAVQNNEKPELINIDKSGVNK
jgi:hypothetical protein